MTDLELQIKLAKLLPEWIEPIECYGTVRFAWKKMNIEDATSSSWIRSTEWLHVCWLIRVKHVLPLLVGCHDPWQQQAKDILNYMGNAPIRLELKGEQ